MPPLTEDLGYLLIDNIGMRRFMGVDVAPYYARQHICFSLHF